MLFLIKGLEISFRRVKGSDEAATKSISVLVFYSDFVCNVSPVLPTETSKNDRQF